MAERKEEIPKTPEEELLEALRERRPLIQFPDILGPLRELGKTIVDAFRGFIDYISDGLGKFWERVIPAKEVLPTEIYSSLTTTTPEWAKPLVNELTHYFISQADTVISSSIESNPYVDTRIQDQVTSKIRTFLLPSTIAIVAASVAAQLAELIHPLRELRVSETVKSILTAMGLFTINQMIWSVLYGEALIQPLKYDLNALLRPWLPPASVVDTMLFQEGIDETAWEDYYRRIEWSDFWINAWRKARYNPPSVWLLYRLMENPNIPEEWYDKVLRYHRYDVEDREVLKEAFKWYSLKDEIYRYRNTLVSWYKKGMLSKDRLISELSNLPLSEEVISWTVALADLESEMEVLEDKVNTIREGFKKGKINELEYINQLKLLGIEDRRISAWLELDKIKRKVELRKTVVSLEEVG